MHSSSAKTVTFDKNTTQSSTSLRRSRVQTHLSQRLLPSLLRHPHTSTPYTSASHRPSWRTQRKAAAAGATTIWASTNMRPCQTWSSRRIADLLLAVATRTLATQSRSLDESTWAKWAREQRERKHQFRLHPLNKRARGSEQSLYKAQEQRES